VLDGAATLDAIGAGVRPHVAVVVLDALHLGRGLALLGEVADLGLPGVALLINRTKAPQVDAVKLAESLGCPLIEATRRAGADAGVLRRAVSATLDAGPWLGAPEGGWTAWRARVLDAAVSTPTAGDGPGRAHAGERRSERIDALAMHPVLGLGLFAAVMTGLFWVIFSLASRPMDLIDAGFGALAGWLGSAMPAGFVGSLVAEGIVPGVGSAVIFLPQIVLLFFLIALLEQSGYLARGALLVDRWLRPFGLSGAAFVPLLSSHACAIPGIMSARTIPDRRERLATILVLPFMSCTARIPVYVLLTVLLFPGRPGVQALAFTGCYVLGALAGLLSSIVARGTLLRGRTRPMVLELPEYRVPSAVQAGRLAFNRGVVFLRKAGTLILAISVVLWWLGAFPRAGESAATAEETPSTYLERLGGAAQPVFAPLGADDTLTVGVLASFVAREVFVTTMAVQVAGRDEGEGVLDELRTAERSDGTRLFDGPTSWAMLVYFVLAMQCLPTLVVTAREVGGWKWAALQFGWMTAVAYGAGALTYAIASVAMGGAGA